MPENIIKELHEYLKEKRQYFKRDKFENIKKDFDKSLNFFPDAEKDRIKEKYKYELEFLEGVTDTSTTPSRFMSKNYELLSKIIGKDSKKEEHFLQEEDIIENNEEIQEVNTSIYIREEKQNLEELENISKEYAEIKDVKYLTDEQIDKLRSLEERLIPVANFIRNASSSKNKNVDNNFFNDKRHDALFLLNSIKTSRISGEIEIAWKEALDLSTTPDELKKFEKIKATIEHARQEVEKLREYFKKRCEYYESLISKPDEKDKDLEFKMDEATQSKKKAEDLLEDSDKIIEKLGLGIMFCKDSQVEYDEIDAKTITDSSDIEYVTVEFENFEPVAVIEENIKKEKKEKKDQTFEENNANEQSKYTEQNATLDDDEYFEGLLNSYNENSDNVIDMQDMNITSDIAESFSYNDTFDETIDEEKIEETAEDINSVSKRITNMVSQRNIKTSAEIQEKLDEIFREMLNPVQKKKSLFKKSLFKKEKSFGDINERLFMDIRSIFSRINKASPFLKEEYADEFAIRLFKNGVPQYMSGKDMDEKLEKEFLSGITKYIEMSESDIFSKDEKDCFEKFVLQPYMLKSIQKNEKDLSSKLKDDTLSMEEIIKKSSKAEKDKEHKVREVKDK